MSRPCIRLSSRFMRYNKQEQKRSLEGSCERIHINNKRRYTKRILKYDPWATTMLAVTARLEIGIHAMWEILTLSPSSITQLLRYTKEGESIAVSLWQTSHRDLWMGIHP